MPEPTSESAVWEYHQPVARLTQAGCSAQVDVSQPHLGLQTFRCDELSIDGPLLSVSPIDARAWPAKVADAYVRGDDLVATYEPNADWPYAPQLYWRASPATPQNGIRATLSLLVSIETSLLDTHPQLNVSSTVAADELLRLTIGDGEQMDVEAVATDRRFESTTGVSCLLWRPPESEFSYAELAPASDYRALSIERLAGGAGRSRWELFGEFLEKGVIWRSQVQLAVVERSRDVELAAHCGRSIAQRALPLTT